MSGDAAAAPPGFVPTAASAATRRSWVDVELTVIVVGGERELLPPLVRGDLGHVGGTGDGVGVASKEQSQGWLGEVGDLEDRLRGFRRVAERATNGTTRAAR